MQLRSLTDRVVKCRALSEQNLRLACFDILVAGNRDAISEIVGKWTYKRAIVHEPPGFSLQILSGAVDWTEKQAQGRQPYLIFACRLDGVEFVWSTSNLLGQIIGVDFAVEGKEVVRVRKKFGYELRIKEHETVRQIAQSMSGGSNLKVTVLVAARGGEMENTSNFSLEGFDRAVAPLREYCSF